MDAKYIIYDPETGQIKGAGSCPESMFEDQGPYTIRGEWDIRTHFVDVVTKTVVRKPTQRNKHEQFDLKERRWKDPRPLDQIKAQVWEKVKEKREAEEAAPVFVRGMGFNADPGSVAKINAHAVTALSKGQAPYTFEWTLLDNTKAVLNRTDLNDLVAAIATRNAAAHAKSQERRARVNAATTVDELLTEVADDPTLAYVLVDNRAQDDSLTRPPGFPT